MKLTIILRSKQGGEPFEVSDRIFIKGAGVPSGFQADDALFSEKMSDRRESREIHGQVLWIWAGERFYLFRVFCPSGFSERPHSIKTGQRENAFFLRGEIYRIFILLRIFGTTEKAVSPGTRELSDCPVCEEGDGTGNQRKPGYD